MALTLPFTDSFTGTDGDNPSADWTERRGGFDIQTNRLSINSTASSPMACHTDVSPVADYYIEGDVYFTSGDDNLYGWGIRRVNYSTDGSNCYIIGVRQSTGDLQLYKRYNGTWTLLDSDATIVVNTSTLYTLKITVDGATQVATFDGGNTVSATDSTISAAGDVAAIANGSNSCDWDSVTVDDLAVGGVTLLRRRNPLQTHLRM